MPPEITRERLNFAQSRKVKFRILSKKYDRFKDPRTDLNRLYIVFLDRNNMEPTGQIERTFSAPLDIPDEYLKFPEGKPWRVELELDRYARYLKHALAEWELRYREIRDSRPKSESDDRVAQIAGPKPQDWRLVVLASRGDPWCLGFTDRRTPAVEAIIGKAPTKAQLDAERARPKDLRLDPELEALIAGGVQEAQFPDEDDDVLAQAASEPVTDAELEAAGIDVEDIEDDDDGELTGNIELDDPDLDDDDGLEDRLALEEQIDRTAKGGKKENPRKRRTRPAREA